MKRFTDPTRGRIDSEALAFSYFKQQNTNLAPLPAHQGPTGLPHYHSTQPTLAHSSAYRNPIGPIYNYPTQATTSSPAHWGPVSPIYDYPTPRSNPNPLTPMMQRQYPSTIPSNNSVPSSAVLQDNSDCEANRFSHLHGGPSPLCVIPAPRPITIKSVKDAQNSTNIVDLIDKDSDPSQYASKSRRRRGSESSDGSSASSSFRECFSSSSSGSDDMTTSSPLNMSGLAVSADPSLSLSRKVTGVLGLGKTQRRIRRIVKTLLASNNRESTGLSEQSAVRDATVALLGLCANPRNKAEVTRRLTKQAATRAQTLAVLFALSDSATDTEVPLQGFSVAARLIGVVMEVPKMGPTVAAFLANPNVTSGAAGIRHLIKTMPPTIQQIADLDGLLLSYVNRLAQRRQRVDGAEDDNQSMWFTFRLLELLLRRRIIHVSQLEQGTLFMLNYAISLFDDKLAPYQVVRSFAGAPPPGFRAETIYLPVYAIVTTSQGLYGRVANHKARCFAFSALAVMLRDHYCNPKEDDDVLLRIIIDVLMWKTPWQHSITKKLARNWDIPEVIPHDDAYTILSLFSPSTFIPMFRNDFNCAISDGSYKILEPLIALIVDHSMAPDSFWPTMLNALVQAGLIGYLMRVSVLELPDQEDRLYRVVQGAKRDAVTGVLRCFEQMPQADSCYIKWEVFDTLEKLIRDEAQPLPVQDIAKIALRTWDL
ncbi:hypothetical protein FRB93_003962 [Tulasnella sp. JGI-2019a]|nr:hypothetical protein FRB93_003962 [Tulasnella sp. JGI-2019a]